MPTDRLESEAMIVARDILAGKEVKKVVMIPDKLVNLVL